MLTSEQARTKKLRHELLLQIWICIALIDQ
jgi:hypothetical protein